jgi:glycosyltransferase involved in cell wall biosynthesis
VRIFGFHDMSACGYYRITQPLDCLAAHGHEIQTACGWDEEARNWPIIIGQRVAKTDAISIWRRLRAQHRLIYELDDNMWDVHASNFRARLEHSPVLLDAVEQALASSHLTIASTEPLAELVRPFQPNVRVVKNRIDARLLDLPDRRPQRITVGWAGGDSHLDDLRLVQKQLQRFLRRNPQVEFHCVGTDFRTLLKLPGRSTGWLDLWDYYRALDFHVGVAPLTRSRFNDCKSHIKALEYAARGIPVVASDEPPYRDFVLDGVTGYLVRDEHEWGARLYELVRNHRLREEMGRKAREVAAEWTIQRGWPEWEAAFASVGGS